MTTRTQTRTRTVGHWYALIKFVKICFLVLLFYLVQTTVIPHMKLWGVVPNLYMVCGAILTVSFGKKYAFACGAVFGILLESMVRTLPIFNLVIYPALMLLCAQIFSDMSEIKRELLRIKIAQRQAESRIVSVGGVEQKKWYHLDFRRKTADDMNPHLRTFLNALMLTLLYDLVMLMYIALDGVDVTFNHLLRIVQSLVYTALWCVTMFPVRLFLGHYPDFGRRKQGDDGLGDEIMTSEKMLRELSLAPDMPNIVAAFDTSPVVENETQNVHGKNLKEMKANNESAEPEPSGSNEKEDLPGKETNDEV